MIKKAKPINWVGARSGEIVNQHYNVRDILAERESIAEELEHIIIEWIEIYECCESCQPLCDKLRALAKELRSGQQ